ncbi:MAG: hypothetical protein ACTSRG_25535, partial [Candidatus Helarchaeota archaeon]
TIDVDFSDSISLDDGYYKVDSYTPTGTDTTGWTEIFTNQFGSSYTADFNISNSIWNSLSDGAHTVYFKGWDDNHNVHDGAIPSWPFYKDTTPPIIIINTISGETYNSKPTFDVDFLDTYSLGVAYYKIDSYTPTGTNTTGWTTIFDSFGGNSYTTDFTISTSVWDSLIDGKHIIYFKTWDDVNNVNDSNLIYIEFYKATKNLSFPLIIPPLETSNPFLITLFVIIGAVGITASVLVYKKFKVSPSNKTKLKAFKVKNKEAKSKIYNKEALFRTDYKPKLEIISRFMTLDEKINALYNSKVSIDLISDMYDNELNEYINQHFTIISYRVKEKIMNLKIPMEEKLTILEEFESISEYFQNEFLKELEEE